ncbi:hypothetical protein PENSPDRAFT_671201 [Peniophora sp. CONT]|nr:hypothetical protein PENSPDRAFT_671201 [Peniophora sp. CONT]
MALDLEMPAFRFVDLPLELVAEIALWGQLIWQKDILSIHAPFGGVQRFTGSMPQAVVRHERCCAGVDLNKLPCCLRVSIPDLARSPAHCLSQTSRRLRNFLTSSNKRIWREDNILYKANAERSGIVTAEVVADLVRSDEEETADAALDATSAIVITRPTVGYGARTLIAPSACACLMPAMPYYHGLRNVKVSVPWDHPIATSRNVEEFFCRKHGGQTSPLEHFDLEIFPCPRAPARSVIRGVSSEKIQTNRTINASFFFFSARLTSLYIYMPFGRTPRFGTLFWDSLTVCALSLQYITVDAGDAIVAGVVQVPLPELRYLRLVLPARECSWFLRSLTLPATLDIHLEPVVAWRRLVIPMLRDRQVFEVPFPAVEAKVEEGLRAAALWRFFTAIAAPEQTSKIFRDPPTVHVLDQSLWQNMTTAGLDVRLDPSTTAIERSCQRFPEYISIAFAASLEEMSALLADVGRDWQHSAPPMDKTSARRSVSVRDGQFDTADRDRAYEAQLVKPVYDGIRYVVNQGLSGPFTSNCLIVRLMFHRDSYLPRDSIGWRHVLEDFDFIEDLHLLSPAFRGDAASFTANMTGFTAPVHLEALALYLNDIRDKRKCPCPVLRRIHVRHSGDENEALFEARMWKRYNIGPRVDVGISPIAIIVTSK